MSIYSEFKQMAYNANKSKMQTNREQSVFKLTGLSREKSITCTPLNNENIFWPRVGLLQTYFDSLWDTIDGNWTGRERVIIEHEGINADGVPIKGVVVGYFTEQEDQ